MRPLFARLFEVTAQSLDVENLQRIADAMGMKIPDITALFIEAEDAVKAEIAAAVSAQPAHLPVLVLIDYTRNPSLVLFSAHQRNSGYYSWEDSSDREGGTDKAGIFYSAARVLRENPQVEIGGDLAAEFRASLPPSAARFIAYEVRPVVETEGNDESKDVESFLRLADARKAYRAAVVVAGLDSFSILDPSHPTDEELDDIAADNDIRLYWTLYGVNADGTSEALSDFEDEAQAFDTLAKITGIAGVSGTVRYDVSAPPAQRLEYLRGEVRAERISYGELSELQSLREHIAPDDVELLEAAGVPEHDDSEAEERPQIVRAAHPDGTRRLFDDGRGVAATDGQSFAPATTETAPAHHDPHGEMDSAGYPEGMY